MAGAPRPDLVGRDVERAELDAALAAAAAGRFGCVLLVGEAGVGKSRLAAGFVERHAPRCTVVTARAHRLGATAPFGVWAEALDRELRARPPEQVRALCGGDGRGGTGGELAALLRGVAALTGPPAVEPSRDRLLDALAALVRALAADRPLIVVADDLHLADASSWVALHHLAHECAGSPVLVVGTMRPIEAAERPDVVEVLLRLEQDGAARRRTVAPLDPHGLRALAAAALGAAPPEPLVDWLAERTRGNPLDALGLLGALLDKGADLERPALRRLPDALADRVALRLAAVDACAVEVVELLAVIGRRAELRSLVALSGRPPTELADALDRLRRARLVVDDDGVVEITHPLVAEAVYERIGGTRRRLLHREAGRVLRSMGRLGEAAGHYVRLARPGDDEAITVLRDAVHAAERAGAFQEALTVLAALVPLLPAGDPRWVDVVDALAWDAQWVLDHRADDHAALGVPALRAMDAALAGLDRAGPPHPGPPPSALPSPARRAAVKLRLASFLGWGTGTLAEAQQVCADAVELFAAAGDRRGTLLAEHELAWLRGCAGDLVVAEDGARAVADAASGDPVVRSRAVRTLGLVAMLRGRPAAAEAAFAETAATADGDRSLMAAGGTAMAAALGGDLARGRATLDRIPADGLRQLADYVAWFHWWAGDVDGVRAVTRDVTGIGRAPASRRRPVGLFAAALAAAEVGATDEARRYTATLRTLYGGSGWVMNEAMAEHLDALAGWRAGRPGTAVPQLRAALRVFVAGDIVSFAVPAALDLAEIAWRAGVPDTCAAAELAAIASRTGVPAFHGAALLASAWSAGPDRAAVCAAAERAVPALPEWALVRARALYLVGRTAGDRERAVAALTDAAALFGTCGATLRRAEATEALATLGSRGRRAAAAARGPSSLTAREREVVELAAGGLSAREIGAELFIGERTVEGHLARAYARLGVRSKVELARRAAELGVRVRTGVRAATPDAGPARS